MKKLILVFVMLNLIIFSFSNIIDLSVEKVYKPYLNDESKGYFDIYGRVSVFSLYTNIPLALNNFYKTDFSEIRIYPDKNLNLENIKIGVDVVNTSFKTNRLTFFPMMHMMYFRRVKRENNIENNIYIPFRVAVENEIKNLNDYKKIEIVLSSGIVFKDKYMIEVGVKDNIENIINSSFKLNWLIGFRYNIF
ncbi:hypothetical protein [Marinitoga aeolica]|uniref:Outer membrane protein beta-barrel domain-containing protein n=1 Tax=Marinitoga aeolica TaxID=2809031 RepID=A0ABY8PTJ4_9BACT|nr:hypothetical protein [Marinitoga aeolica]WGS65920.1 hypothetical protein JRV97_05070 [Marinitoga aeolica]